MSDKIDVLDKGYVRLVDHMGSDLSVVNAARASFSKESDILKENDKKLIKFLGHNGHTSPFRHAFLQFEVYAPLMVARQWWKYVVGSDHCQPEGTLVTKVNDTKSNDGRKVTTQEVPIETIQKGDRVISFKYDGSAHLYRKGKVVTDTFSRPVNEDLIQIRAGDCTSKYTQEHPCTVKVGDAFNDGYVVYLMQKGNSFRVGQTQARRNDSLGIRVRFTRETADAVWVLGVYTSKEEARYQESVLSYRYGMELIPM